MMEIQKIEYNNRKYIWNGNLEPTLSLSIESSENDIPPEKFTKYCTLTDYNIEALLNNYLYAAHPYELNDPFDCFSRLIDTSKISDEDINFLESRLKIEINKEEIHKHPEKFIDILYLIIFQQIGIISFTDSENENPNLWANYSNKHKGFSITYLKNAIDKVAVGPFKVDYVKKLEKVKFDRKNINSLQLFLMSIKSDYWSSEQEWRYIGLGKDLMYIPYKHHGEEKERKQQNRKLYLQKNSVSDIRLGFNFFNIENMQRNNLNEVVVNLNKENDKELKSKLFNYALTNSIPLSMIFIHKHDFNFVALNIEYEFVQHTNIFKYRLPSP